MLLLFPAVYVDFLSSTPFHRSGSNLVYKSLAQLVLVQL